MIGNAFQYMAQVGFRILIVELGGADQTVDRGGPLATGVGTAE